MEHVYISPKAEITLEDAEVIEAMTEALVPTAELVNQLFMSITKNAKPFAHLVGVFLKIGETVKEGGVGRV